MDWMASLELDLVLIKAKTGVFQTSRSCEMYRFKNPVRH